MNKISFVVLFVILAFSLIICSQKVGYSQEVKKEAEEVVIKKSALEFAQRSLKSYVNNVINEKNFMKFGFKSIGGAQIASVGDPYRVMTIGLKDLKTYKPGTGAKPLLMDVKIIWFPVMVEDEILTKLEIIEKEGKLISGEFGKITIVKEVATAKNRLPELLRSKEIEAPHKIFLLKIPALYAMFLYVESSKGEFLIPSMMQPQRYDLQNAQIYTADEVLSKLMEFAKKIDEKKLR